MQPLNEFLVELAHDIHMTKKGKIDPNQPLSFVTFLGTLTDKKLESYSTDVEKLIKKEGKPTTEEIEKGILFYSLIITELENQSTHKNVRMDDEGTWAVALFLFLTLEKFYRERLIANFSGFLKDGKPMYQPTKKMFEIKESVLQNMTPEQRKKYNI
jgi:hypothetical protein